MTPSEQQTVNGKVPGFLLDKGRGECHLGPAEIAKLVEDNFRRFGEYLGSRALAPGAVRYELRAWVLMPNHVHVLFKTGAVWAEAEASPAQVCF